MIYAGIGSRETPKHICELMTQFAKWANEIGFICSTGGAKGADEAFIKGAGEKLHNWLPWDGYNGYRTNMPDVTPAAAAIAKKFHPNWAACTAAARMLHARNCNIVLGRNLKSPVDFIVCWTKDGLEIGGTAQALRVAKEYNIPIINLGVGDPHKKIEQLKILINNVFSSDVYVYFNVFDLDVSEL